MHRIHARWVGAVLFFTCLAGAMAMVPPPHPLPSGILQVLYAEPPAEGRAGIVSVVAIAGRGNRLYVALSDDRGHEVLDVWDTRDPGRCVLLDSIDFGHVESNGVQFTPLALIPFADGLLLQTLSGLTVYRHAEDGRLVVSNTLPHPDTELGSGLTQIHHYGNYGSVYQQVIPNAQIDGHNLDQIHRHVLLDLAQPWQPSLLWLGSDGPRTLSETPVNAAFLGNPASLSYSFDQNSGTLTVWEPRLDDHLSKYWMPKINTIFDESVLTLSLRDLVAAAVGHLDLVSLQAAAIAGYSNQLAFGDATLTGWIQRYHADGEPLADVMAEYGISLDDSLEFALIRLFEQGFTLDLEQQISRILYAPALEQWLETIVKMQEGWETIEDVYAHLAQVFNEELDAGSLIEYLTLKVVSPLIGDPAFMRMTLQDLIDEIVASPLAEVLDELLTTVGGFGTLNAVLDRIDRFLGRVDALPGVSAPRLPEAWRFPDSTATLIDYGLYSWNREQTGDVLDPNGLAWFELLKFYRYLSGDELDFTGYLKEIDEIIRQMQATLGAELFGKLSGVFEGISDVNARLDDLHEAFAAQLESRHMISGLLAARLHAMIDPADVLDLRQPLSSAFAQWELNVGRLGMPESTIADLETALRDRALDALRLDAIPLAAATAESLAVQRQIEQVLRTRIQIAFGINDPDLTLMDALLPYLTQQIPLDQTMGNHLSAILNAMLFEGTSMGQLLLTYRRAFEHGDAIAQWLVALDAVALATAWIDGGSAAMAMEFCLSEAYDAGVDYLVNALYGLLIGEIVDAFLGDQSRWIAMKLEARTWAFDLDESDDTYQLRTLGAFAWQQQVGLIQQIRWETNWFGPRNIRLQLFHPADPLNTLETIDLGRWTHLNYVQHAEGAVFLAGTFFNEDDGLFPSGMAMILDVAARPVRQQSLCGDTFLSLASSLLLASANHRAHLAVGGVDRVFLMPNPAAYSHTDEQLQTPPHILVPPQAATAREGDTASMTVHAIGSAPLHYQWFKNGTAIPDAEFDEVTWTPVLVADAADYHVVVSNAVGQAVSAAVALVVEPASTLTITSAPTSRIRFEGQTTTFSVGVDALRPVDYQWLHDGLAIAGANATGATLSVGPLTASNAGLYSVVVSDGVIEQTSVPARLVVIKTLPPRVFTMPDFREQLLLGSSNVLTVAAGGYAPLVFAWTHNGVPLDGIDGPSLDLGAVARDAAGQYAVHVTDASGASVTVEFQVLLVGSMKLTVDRDPEGNLLIHLDNGQPGEAYTLEQSVDLIEWTPLTAGVYPENGSVLLNQGQPQPTPVFYRVRLDP